MANPAWNGEDAGAPLEVVCEFYTPRDVSVLLNLSTDMVYNLLKEGVLPAIRLGTGRRQIWRIPIADLRRFLDTVRTGPRFE